MQREIIRELLEEKVAREALENELNEKLAERLQNFQITNVEQDINNGGNDANEDDDQEIGKIQQKQKAFQKMRDGLMLAKFSELDELICSLKDNFKESQEQISEGMDTLHLKVDEAIE